MNLLIILLLLPISYSETKYHHLSLRDDWRRNIYFSKFGYGDNGTLDIAITNFTVPDKILDTVDVKAERLGVIGFSLSRGPNIVQGVGSNPHVCQLEQTDQGFDAVFFFADLPNKRLRIYRSGIGRYIRICPSYDECAIGDPTRTPSANELTNLKKNPDNESWFQRLFAKIYPGGEGSIAYENYIPLDNVNGNRFSTNISVRFAGNVTGEYVFLFHNCYNYKEYGYSERVAIDLTVDLIEKNQRSFLSVSDIPKPQILLYSSVLFFMIAIFWTHRLCVAESRDVYRVHICMSVLIFLKAFSLFFHGFNLYYLSKYGHQKEFWALVYYVTHLLKGLLLFGTIILIGTGYTFVRQFLTERDRRVFMMVLPIQVLDNIFLIILNESELGAESHQMWLSLFTLLDIICCFAVLFPIIWSIKHLYEGAHSDGKAAFNLTKLRLFREFYILVICYIYVTRLFSFLLKQYLSFEHEWVVMIVVESVTLIFYVIVGLKFRPGVGNSYLRLSTDDFDDYEDENSVALTTNGLLESITNRNENKEISENESEARKGTITKTDSFTLM